MDGSIATEACVKGRSRAADELPSSECATRWWVGDDDIMIIIEPRIGANETSCEKLDNQFFCQCE